MNKYIKRHLGSEIFRFIENQYEVDPLPFLSCLHGTGLTSLRKLINQKHINQGEPCEQHLHPYKRDGNTHT